MWLLLLLLLLLLAGGEGLPVWWLVMIGWWVVIEGMRSLCASDAWVLTGQPPSGRKSALPTRPPVVGEWARNQLEVSHEIRWRHRCGVRGLHEVDVAYIRRSGNVHVHT